MRGFTWVWLICPLALIETSMAFDWDSITRWAAVNTLLFPLVLLCGVALHEVGHLLTASAAGLAVPRVHIGVGEPRLRWTWRRRRFWLCGLPLVSTSFFTAPASLQRRGLRWRLWLAALGGPLITLTVLVGAIALGDLGPRDVLWPNDSVSHRLAPFELIAFTSFLLLPFNLLPFPSFDGAHTDGSWLLRSPRMPDAALHDAFDMVIRLEIMDCLMDGDHERAEEHLQRLLARQPLPWQTRESRSFFFLHTNQPHAARAELLEVLSDPAIRPFIKTMLQANLAWANFMIAAPKLLAEADTLSADAHKRFRSNAAINGTRGAVLSWKGQHAEAIALLERAFSGNPLPQNRALNACCLTLAYSALNQHAHALRWLDRARLLDPNCLLLPRATAAFNNIAPSYAA